LSSALAAENFVQTWWFILDDKIKLETLANTAHTEDNELTCQVCNQSFKCIRELCCHLEIPHITLEPDELPKHFEMVQSNIVENGKNINSTANTKKITSNVPHVLATQNIERSNHLLHTQIIECSKRQSCSDTSDCFAKPDKLRSSIETVNIVKNVEMLTSIPPHLLNTQMIKNCTSHAYSESSNFKEVLLELPKSVEAVYLQPTCSICSKSFLHEERLKLHLLEHSSVDILECPACNEKFNTIGECKSHVELHRTFRLCVLCNKHVSTKSRYMDHMHMQHSVQSPGTMKLVDPKTGQLVCKHCGEKFVKNKLLLAHVMLFDETHVVCDVCGRIQMSKFKLKHHLSSGVCSGRKYSCPDCEGQFLSSTILKNHSRVHTGLVPPKTFVCARCGKSFEKAWFFKMHMASHNGERPFLCTICSKRYALASRLREHMLSHSEDRPHACQVCSARFKSKCLLHQHMRIHAEQPLHVCEVCHKGFNCRGHLKVHMRTHSGARPYQCTECTQSFAHPGTLKKHLKSHLQ